MSIFDTLIVQPIFNVLLTIYSITPGNDLGIALIIFTVLVRLVMWPLIKKQLHQTKLMRQVQPETKKIKQKAKGNRALEAQMMMELYKERGIKPFSSIGLLIVQLPIFFALFRVIQIITVERQQIATYAYDFVEKLGPIGAIIAHPEKLNETLLGFIDLTKHAIGNNAVYVPLVILAVVAAVLQFIQSKQLLPQQSSKKKLREILKDSAAGKDVDQSEVTAIMSGRMIMVLPILLFFVALYLPGALVLYYAATSFVAIIQQHMVLSKDVTEMEAIADSAENTPKKAVAKKATPAKTREANATEATVVAKSKKKTTAKSRKRR
ncbi:MAG TPA: YidC/Oxa1 family membrane protein insertase [Verrucomicrobiae bacterium]|nr:YidC/Oxa1 family membrane protein insertase [Verrucomicrobiae bacterium]